MYIDKDINDIKWDFKLDDGYVSEMLLMKSAAGWYFGRVIEIVYDFRDGIQKGIEPFDRATDYLTHKEAQKLESYYLD